MSLFNEEQTQRLREQITPKVEQWLEDIPEPPARSPGQTIPAAEEEQVGSQSWLGWTREALLGCGRFVLGAAGTVLLVSAIWVATVAMEGRRGHDDQEVRHQQPQQREERTRSASARAQKEAEDLAEEVRGEGPGSLSAGAASFLAD